MTTLTVTAKGQVTLKKNVLSHLGIKPGDKIEVDLLPGGKAAFRAERAVGSIDGFIGCLRSEDGKRLTIQEIEAIARGGWARRK